MGNTSRKSAGQRRPGSQAKAAPRKKPSTAKPKAAPPDWRSIEIHPFADALPMMTAEEYEALKRDISANGCLNPVWLYEGRILDGRHRFRACRELGIEPPFALYSGTDPEALSESQNDHRRHEDRETVRRRRIERVAKLRAQGKSLRVIAEETGIDQRQVQRDLRTVSADDRPADADKTMPETADPVVPAVPPLKVTGRNGRRYPASREPATPSDRPGETSDGQRKSVRMAAALRSLEMARQAVNALSRQTHDLLRGPLGSAFLEAAQSRGAAIDRQEEPVYRLGDPVGGVAITHRWPLLETAQAILEDVVASLSTEGDGP